MAAFDGRLWVLGGHRGIADSPTELCTDGNRNDCWTSVDGVHWEELPATPWTLRHACAVHVHEGSLLLAAGSAVMVSTEEVDKTRADFNHRTECTWRQPDVWKQDRKEGASARAARL